MSRQTPPLNVGRIGGVAMAGNLALESVPMTQEPHRNRDSKSSAAHCFCHAHYTHVSQTLWRGLPRRASSLPHPRPRLRGPGYDDARNGAGRGPHGPPLGTGCYPGIRLSGSAAAWRAAAPLATPGTSDRGARSPRPGKRCGQENARSAGKSPRRSAPCALARAAPVHDVGDTSSKPPSVSAEVLPIECLDLLDLAPPLGDLMHLEREIEYVARRAYPGVHVRVLEGVVQDLDGLGADPLQPRDGLLHKPLALLAVGLREVLILEVGVDCLSGESALRRRLGDGRGGEQGSERPLLVR